MATCSATRCGVHAPARQENGDVFGDTLRRAYARTTGKCGGGTRRPHKKSRGHHNKLPLRGGKEGCVLPLFIRKNNSIPCTLQISKGSPPFAIKILDAFDDTSRCPLNTRRGGVNCDVFGDTLRRACARTTGKCGGGCQEWENARSMWCFNSWCICPRDRNMWWRGASPSQNVGETTINCRAAEGRRDVYYDSL